MASRAWAAYGHLVAAQVRGQAQYRASFAVDIVGSVMFGVLDVVSVLVLFRVTPLLGGFAFAEVFLMSALAACAFAIADLAVGNVERLNSYVRGGLLDAVLVRPMGVLSQLAAMDVAARRVGRVLFGVVIVGVAATVAGVPATPMRLALLAATPIAGAVIFGAIFVATAAVAFWWIDAGEVANGLTYGGLTFTEAPISVYGPVLRRLFAYGAGLGFVGYYPALALLDRPDPLGGPAFLGYAAPLVALVLAGAAALVWRKGVRHYRSTGS